METKSNKKLWIICTIFTVIVLLGIGIFIASIINTKKHIVEIENQLANDKYVEVYALIKDNHLSSNKKIEVLLEKELEQYVISNEKDLASLSEEDWTNIKDLSRIGNELNINNVNFNYLNGLLKIQENYGEYFSAIQWINSADYEQYKIYSQLNGSSESDILQTCSLLSKYSFEKYGLDNTYIKELNAETQVLLEAYNNILTALRTRNTTLLEEAKNSSTESLSSIADIQINILNKSTEITKELKKLSNNL